MNKYIEPFQYITHEVAGFSHLEQVRRACEAGAKWVQYRCLCKVSTELLKEVQAIASVCDDWGCTLIVTDHVQLYGKADIQGFHIEDPEADFAALRKDLGNDVVLGGSANTLDGLLKLASYGVDYAGFGPFAKTTTKPNDSPLIDLEQYKQAQNVIQERSLDFPFLAVGGIQLSDVSSLMKTGIYGIAVSAAIHSSLDFETAYQAFYQQVKTKHVV